MESKLGKASHFSSQKQSLGKPDSLAFPTRNDELSDDGIDAVPFEGFLSERSQNELKSTLRGGGFQKANAAAKQNTNHSFVVEASSSNQLLNNVDRLGNLSSSYLGPVET